MHLTFLFLCFSMIMYRNHENILFDYKTMEVSVNEINNDFVKLYYLLKTQLIGNI